ncbi:unnamed protein product [Microthlaspi erraticum]|uniref:Myb-like domain-containing protein n=1 Tax=Microthlaspi erraticum TaxID=1685480 RepID=A0A6D2HIV1_9BRAS|nr:unnamed protein product [Microthlaspi erraticum]
MDSYTLGNSRSYLELLQRQQESFHPVGSSAIPPFFQPLDDPLTEEESPVERKVRRKWTQPEDVVLISAWLHTSKDPLRANQQKAGTFWKRITEFFNSSPTLDGLQPRAPTHCKQRWQKMNNLVCKFVGAYDAAMKQTSSGQNDNDTLFMAHQIFYNDYKFNFNLEYAWTKLRHDQKWLSMFITETGGSSKRSRGEAAREEGDADEARARPMGVKAAKAKAKKGTRESEPISAEKYESMSADRKHDLAVRERLSKQAVLDSLLAKKEPLTEKEIALKDKLLDFMLLD